MDVTKLTMWLRQRTSLLLTHPGFLRLWAGLSISVLGDWVGHMALTLHVYNVTGSASALATLTIVRSLPVLLFGPVAGVMADRFSRRRIMIWSDIARALLYALLEPWRMLRGLEDAGRGAEKLALVEHRAEFPFAAVWDHACLQADVPPGASWLREMAAYEEKVLSKRE